MPLPRNRKHLIVPGTPKAEPYEPHGRKIPRKVPPAPPSRQEHAAGLRQAIQGAVAEAKQRRLETGMTVHGAQPGINLELESIPGWELAVASLGTTSKEPWKRIEVLSVMTVPPAPDAPPGAEPTQRATVFVPDGQVGHFLKRLKKYASATPRKKGERRHEDLFDRIGSLQLATLQALWTDAPEAYPALGEVIWWEVWLRRQDGRELERMMEFAGLQDIKVGERRLGFEDRIVTLVRASAEQLSSSIDVLGDVAEVRKAKECATLFVDLPVQEQAAWAAELLERTMFPGENAPAVCILDTGVTQGHPLLRPCLELDDCHSCEPAWGTHDHDGHGTEMAGLAVYGDLTPQLGGVHPVEIRHRLESVKILPPSGANVPELYGAITAEATSRVEIQAPERRRCFSMAVAATDERDRGQPTSWSSAVDALAAGRSFDVEAKGLVYLDDAADPLRRLFILCAGNVQPGDLQVTHLDRSDADPIHDPAQAWNALTVGAYTEKAVIQDDAWTGWSPLAPAGELSPWSTTGVGLDDKWPLKPDIVLEGGNVVRNGENAIDFPCSDLCLLSTNFKPAEKVFTLSWATSAATAQAARLAATIAAEYPLLWPEAIRALMVHSAGWTPRMLSHLMGANGKRQRARLVRRYGFGVPDRGRALRSANDSLTLIAQGSIRPFAAGKLREMHFYELSWPRETLQGLGDAPVRLRVTLSYFVEPNPARRGWRKRYQYPSHGLRFDVKGPTETMDELRKRLNKRALEEDEEKPSTGADSSEWYLGEHARYHGSIHSDMLSTSAADLAERGIIAVFPIGGWWKEQPKRDRSVRGARYALIVSIETPGVETDIWTPVAQKIGVPIAIDT